MTDRADMARSLLADLQDTLALLDSHTGAHEAGLLQQADPLPSLLERCVALARTPVPPLRSIHHMACTGGSLISKCLSLLPNVVLLSEIDPLSDIPLPKPGKTPMFRPSDLIYAARTGARPIDSATIEQVFVASVRAMHDSLAAQGQFLCLRDHAHSQFCTDTVPEDRPSLRMMMQRVAPVLSVVTVRHPLDSYLSLYARDWLHFDPKTADEYARRYLLFLDAHEGLDILRYEDFVADPGTGVQRLCDRLELPHVDEVQALLPLAHLSGDSGRSSTEIAPRPRRPVPQEITDQAVQSDSWRDLCARLGYPIT